MEDNVWRDHDADLHHDLLLFTFIGVTYMEEGVTEFLAWSEKMLAELAKMDADGLRPFLRVEYVNSKALRAKFRKVGGPNWGDHIVDDIFRAFDDLDERKKRNSDYC